MYQSSRIRNQRLRLTQDLATASPHWCWEERWFPNSSALLMSELATIAISCVSPCGRPHVHARTLHQPTPRRPTGRPMQQDAGEQVEGAGVDGQIRHCVVFESISNWLLLGSGVLGLGHATKATTRAPSRALPRRRALCTNSKKPR
jgi:hypothetical protein